MKFGLMKIRSLLKEKLNTQIRNQGKINILEDTGEVYYDVSNDIRVKIRDIVLLENELDRMLTIKLPDTFYFVKDTKVLWHFDGSTWSNLNPAVTIPKNNMNATSDPNQTDNDYMKGSLWFNTTAGSLFVCTNVGTEATWQKVTVGFGG